MTWFQSGRCLQIRSLLPFCIGILLCLTPILSHASLILNELTPGQRVVINTNCDSPPRISGGEVEPARGCDTLTVTVSDSRQLVASDGTIYRQECATGAGGGGASLAPTECYYIASGQVPTDEAEEPETTPSRGLVPCGGTGQEPCQACHVIDLTNNVIGWLVIILGSIAAIIIIVAGAKLLTANGNQRAMEDAKSMINNMIIGYVIVLAGWLLVDTVLKAVLNEGQYGVWNQVQCVDQPVAVFNEYEPWEGGVLTTNCIPLPNGSWNCGQQNTSCAAGGGIPADDPMTPSVFECDYPGGTGARPPDLSAGGACDAGLISPYFGNLTGSAQCIIEAESACGASMVSRTDVMSYDGRAFSFGPMQINLTVHVLEGCSGYPPVMRCLDAFSGRNYDARVIDESLYQQCARAAQDMNCNIKNGARIYAEAGNSWSPWSTAAGCGLY